jgi:prepilin-type N-terminal cleavage/methylation domain-containing protein/prepilin-type processing-associated H-X9-DG protein
MKSNLYMDGLMFATPNKLDTAVRRIAGAPERRRQAFTLVEFLLVIAVIAIMISLLLPYLWWAKEEANRTTCESNHHQLCAAAMAYSQDYNGYLVDGATHAGAWVNSGNDNYAIASGTLFKYVNAGSDCNIANYTAAQYDALPKAKALKLYKCPSDWITSNNRTYSVNGFLNGDITPGINASYDWPISIFRLAQVTRPAQTFYFIDEYDYRSSYNNGSFVEHPFVPTGGRTSDRYYWVDVPGLFHLDGNNISFVDGHVEWWAWADPRTLALPPGAAGSVSAYYGNPAAPNNDLLRLISMVGDYK